MTLLNPFTSAHAPRVELPPSGKHVAAASSSEHVSRVHGRWVLHPTNGYGDADAAGRAIKLEDMRDVFFHEIMLSAPPNAAGHECVAMAMLGCSTEVAFCRVGVDSAWTLLDTNWSSPWGPSFTAKNGYCSDTVAGAGGAQKTSFSPSERLYERENEERENQL